MKRYKFFSQRLQYLVDNKNISQIELAKEVDVTGAMVSKWLSGKVATPRRTTLQKLSTFFGCSIEWLVDGKGKPFPTTQEPNAKDQPATVPQQDETFSIKETLSMATELLESESEYKNALATNIRLFHQAFTMENDMRYVEKELEGMQKRMERMEQMLLSLGATLPEKRDKAANS